MLPLVRIPPPFSVDVICASSPRLHFHHICGTDVDTSANATAQCGLALEMSDGHFYQLDASNKFFDFANDDPDKVSHHYPVHSEQS